MQVESLMGNGHEAAEDMLRNAQEESGALLATGQSAAGTVLSHAQASAHELVGGARGRAPLLPASLQEGLGLLELLPAAFANVPGAQAQGADAVALLPAATAAESAAALLPDGARADATFRSRVSRQNAPLGVVLESEVPSHVAAGDPRWLWRNLHGGHVRGGFVCIKTVSDKIPVTRLLRNRGPGIATTSRL